MDGRRRDPMNRLSVVVTTNCVRKKDDYHFHDYTQIWYLLAGTLKNNFTDHTFVQKPGSCCVVLPHTLHSIDTSESEDTPLTVSISFTDEFLTARGYRFFSYSPHDARFEERMIPAECEFGDENKEQVDAIVRKIVSEFSKHKEMDFDIIAELIVELLRFLCKEKGVEADMLLVKERAEAISAAVNYIQENLKEKITIDMLCSKAAMSRSVFTKSFKAVTGMTVAEYIAYMRIRQVQYLLLFTDMSLNEIASETGLCDKSHLSRVFKKRLGISPLEHRKQRRAEALLRDAAYKKRWQWLG